MKTRESISMAPKNQENVANFVGVLKKQGAPTLASRGRDGRGPATGLATSLIGLGTSALKQMIDKQKKKYTAEWKDGLNDLYFYDQLSTQGPFDPVGLQFNGFRLERKIVNQGSGPELAMLLDVELATDTANIYEMFNNAVFKLKLKDIQINYAKAKIPQGKSTLNVDIEVTFNTSYVNNSGNLFKNVELGKFFLRLRDAPLDKSSPGYKEYYAKKIGKQLEGWSFLVPRSYGYRLNESGQMEESYSQGAYSIAVKVTESSKSDFVTQMIIDNSNSMIDSGADQAKKTAKQLLDK
ncbi:hypothetical protein EOD41_14295 [Mucilaginibacter limnophilus]|uniref:Uncharacterized protein n=1 Tax=Mucilaginibacter limnophilus TaxID=1932778 RepID=A0A3S2UK75_9SPHI|nr:hypothetical protein [Mucilaginibacter limnophilus]RVU00126.1 hypothetical protein EOD41_14295 [Mucilaginibacter limnophilus]